MTSCATVAGRYARLVKIEHSVFALPFAYVGLFLAAGGWPGTWTLVALTVAMVAIRSYAMAVNRLADLPFDRENPRTRGRELVTGEVGVGGAVAFTALCAVVFVLACAGLNALCLALSPVVLVWAGLYSFAKRFTWLCHFLLGSVLGLAPVAGWLAFDPSFSVRAVLFGLGVTFWTAGFDILYACQDVEFDREHDLRSIPACFGIGPALAFSSLAHVNAVIFFALGGWAAGLSWIYFTFFAASAVLLCVEHLILSEEDLSRVNVSFFTINGVVAAGFGLGVIVDVFAG
ncbi:UbiA-like polyprenyltransferase [Desulfolutivibrio sulfoxidireducens]|uniref:UbiA-like polyprenyltransferase n=1 Tax=Desulfolutivibrio sulfoxidireducens TaxID=2773299 RepID=UPI00159D0693|nr:UbiA-like polyprenyltransferase [Desulfolutivibrio sulfoxidireducens]